MCVIRMCDVTHSNVWHDLFICVTWSGTWFPWDNRRDRRTNKRVVDEFSGLYVTSLIQMCAMTRSYVWHYSCICVIHMCDMTHAYVSFICVTWLMHMCDMTHPHVWHDSFTCVTWPLPIFVMTHAHAWHGLTYLHEWYSTSINMCAMHTHQLPLQPGTILHNKFIYHILHYTITYRTALHYHRARVDEGSQTLPI